MAEPALMPGMSRRTICDVPESIGGMDTDAV
jgi:hypothetical protein